MLLSLHLIIIASASLPSTPVSAIPHILLFLYSQSNLIRRNGFLRSRSYHWRMFTHIETREFFGRGLRPCWPEYSVLTIDM